MPVRKIRNSWWVDFRVEGVRHRRRSPANSRAGAAEYEATLRRRLAGGKPLDGRSLDAKPSSPQFNVFAQEWLDTYVKPNLKPSSARTWRGVVRRHLTPFLGTRALDAIGPDLLERYKAVKLGEGLKPQTVNKHLTALRHLFGCAQEWGRLAAIPRVKKLREPPLRFTFLSMEECERLLADRTNRRAHEMVLVALRTGMRIGEILALDWSDIDDGRREVTIRHGLSDGVICTPKNNKERLIPLSGDLHQALAARGQASGLVFATRTGRPLCSGEATNALRSLCRRTGVRRIGWHALRHTFASLLVMAGVPLRVVQELLGHADLRMTVRYTHLAPASLRQAITVFERPPNSGQQVVNAAANGQMPPKGQDAESPDGYGRSWAWPLPAPQLSR